MGKILEVTYGIEWPLFIRHKLRRWGLLMSNSKVSINNTFLEQILKFNLGSILGPITIRIYNCNFKQFKK